jgi:hypothetical protein
MAVDLSAIAKWPNVPACYDWLSLDRRGDWRLQGERVTHRGLIDFMNRQYGGDDSGCWFVQNGPQRVFVELAYTPWVFRREGDGFVSHTGQAAGAVSAVYLDEGGSILLHAEPGIGLLDDRDLARFFGECCAAATGDVADDHTLLELMRGDDGSPVRWRDIPLQRIAAVDVPERFNFSRRPQPGA